MDCSTIGSSVLHCLLEFAHTHVHWVDDAIQPSHPVTHFSYSQSFPASPGVCLNSYQLSQQCYLPYYRIPSPFSFYSSIRVFPMSQLFASDVQSVGVSASVTVFPINIQSWFPLGLTGLISLQSKGLARVFSRTTVQKHQFFSAQHSLFSYSYTHTWLLEKR